MAQLQAAPVLSTPDDHVLKHQADQDFPELVAPLSDEQLYISYEIERTILEIRQSKYKRVALQFPDNLLRDAPRVYERLRVETNASSSSEVARAQAPSEQDRSENDATQADDQTPVKFYILGDTSYAPCCVDEIAAEHINADVVVHYGRTCLSPTAKLPTIYVFTRQPISSLEAHVDAFGKTYVDRDERIILMADVMYQERLRALLKRLRENGYAQVFVAEIIHDPSSLIPNRTTPAESLDGPQGLRQWSVFHLSNPPDALLLTLSSRVKRLHILSVSASVDSSSAALEISSQRALNRRYGLLTAASSASVFGILINTLSIKNFRDVAEKIKSQIAAAGKKSYTIVVGKLNAAKVANFSEVDAWVVFGCWESSLVESRDFWKPLITPFELELALQPDDQRLWTGEWRSDFRAVLGVRRQAQGDLTGGDQPEQTTEDLSTSEVNEGPVTEPESAAPDFDLRRGRFVSQARPLQIPSESDAHTTGPGATQTLTIRVKGDIARVGGVVSPGAEFLRSKRTWQGLGSDLQFSYVESGTAIEEGRSGIARGYTHANAVEGRT